MGTSRSATVWTLLACASLTACPPPAPRLTPSTVAPLSTAAVGTDVVFVSHDGVLAVEAEHFAAQRLHATRAWYVTDATQAPAVEPDGDPHHLEDASGDAYVEVLPDTRRTGRDPLAAGENFSDAPGALAVLDYRVRIDEPGRYHVWARIHSTGTEDNGLHVGLDGRWPESGQRMQWTTKRRWAWDSRQRTAEVHTGVRGLLYLDVEQPGEHVISFSMREDGVEFDKWLLTRDPEFEPEGQGPAPVRAR